MLQMLSPPGADPADPQSLQYDMEALRWEIDQGYQRLYWESKTRADSLQTEVNTLDSMLKTLQGKVAELETWRGETESGIEGMDQELREKILETNGDISAVKNRINIINGVIVQHHPESYEDLGYTLNEDAASGTDPGPAPVVETVQ